MSMRDYPVDNYGMILDEEQIKALAKHRIPKDEWEENDWDNTSVWEMAEHLELESFGEFNGEANMAREDGYFGFENYLIDDDCFFIPLNNYPTLFKQAYKSLDEAKKEIAEKIDYLFPVEIYHITGTYYG